MKKGKPSATARVIARSQVLLFHEGPPSGSVQPHILRLYRMFLNECSGGRDRMLDLFPIPWIRRILFRIESLILPGIFRHYSRRKERIRQITEKSLSEGFTQVVILGAGYDALAIQMRDEHPEVRCFEFDNPTTQAIKVNALRKAGIPTERLECIPCDLQSLSLKDLESVASLAQNRATLFIAEGLFMYFSASAVGKLLGVVSDFCHGRGRIVFTFLEPNRRGRGDFAIPSRVLRLWLRLKGEVFSWGCPVSQIFDFLLGPGWIGIDRLDPETGDPADAPESHAFSKRRKIGEYICVADRR